MNIDVVLSEFEPAFRTRLERKVFETTVEGFVSLWPVMLWTTPMYFHLAYLAYYRAMHGGSWIAWLFVVVLSALTVASIFVIFLLCSKGGQRTRQKYAEESRWSIAEFQRIAAQFPDRKKKEFLKQYERNLKEAAAFMV